MADEVQEPKDNAFSEAFLADEKPAASKPAGDEKPVENAAKPADAGPAPSPDKPKEEPQPKDAAPKPSADAPDKNQAAKPDAAAAEITPQTPAAPVEAQKAEEKRGVDPEQFKGYLDEREKRQKLEADAEQLRRENAQIKQQLEQQKRQEEQKPPDRYDDPDGFDRWQQGQLDTALMRQRNDMSEFNARREFGDDLINKVDAWLLSEGKQHVSALMRHVSPYHAAVEVYRKEQSSSTLKTYDYDLEKAKTEWRKEWEAELAAKAQPQQPAPAQPASSNTSQPQKPADKLPPNVANSGGTEGKPVTLSGGEFFSSVFSR